jgi:hypothetical protein
VEGDFYHKNTGEFPAECSQGTVRHSAEAFNLDTALREATFEVYRFVV